MKALLKDDIILGWCDNGTEVGLAPAGVGLERLRFNGEKIIDLATLTAFYVVFTGGVYSLHCLPVKNSQPVTMTYAQRKLLFDDSGTYRILTPEEAIVKQNALTNLKLKTNLREGLTKDMGDVLDMVADLTKCLTLVLVYLEGGEKAAAAKTIIDTIAPLYCDIYDNDSCETKLTSNAIALRARLTEYYANQV